MEPHTGVKEKTGPESNRLNLLLQTGHMLAATNGSEKLLQRIVASAAQVAGVDSAAIYLLKDDQIELKAAFPALPEDFPYSLCTSIINEHPHAKQAITSRQPVLVSDTHEVELSEAEKAIIDARNLRSLLFIPLHGQGSNPVGILVVGSVNEVHRFSREDVDVCMFLAIQASVELERTCVAEERQQYASGIKQELHHREQTEQALRRSEELLRKTQEIANLGSWELDFVTNRLVWSDEVYRIFGLPPQQSEATYEAFLKTVHPDDREEVDRAFVESVHNDSTGFDMEFRIVQAASGEVRHVHEQCIHARDGAGNVIRSTGMVRDITVQKQAEEYVETYLFLVDRLYSELNAEMQKARLAHQRLLPKGLPQIEGISLVAVNSPATYIGGDFAYATQKGDLLILSITDVTGHGLEGTLFSLFVKGCIESYIQLLPEAEIIPDRMLGYLAQQVHRSEYPSEYAVAIFLMVVNVKTRETVFSSAGFHNPPILVHGDGSTDVLLSKGLPISPDIPADITVFENHTGSIPENALVFLATDGIYEQRQGNEMYEQRLLSLLKQCNHLPHSTVADQVHADFRDFLGEEELADDITFLVLSTLRGEKHTLPSSLDALATARKHVLAYYGAHPRCETIAEGVHELLTNAIKHGNEFDQDKNVRMLLSAKAVVVEDEGDGFNWSTELSKNLSRSSNPKRRCGIAMTQMLVGELIYNEKGNRVSMLIDG